MREVLSKIWRDLKDRRHVDAYAISFIAFVIAVLSVIGDVVPEQVRWAAVLAGVGVLVLRSAFLEPSQRTIEQILTDRFAFDAKPITERLKNATEVWVYAPSAVNLLSTRNCDLLRTGCLSKADGSVRIVVLDPGNDTAIKLARHQLDDSLDYPIQEFSASLNSTIKLLKTMSSWQLNGSFNYRLLGYNPGFSLVGIDPNKRDGYLIIEFHGFHNESTSSRMHVEISRKDSDHWYEYWIDQFSRIWDAAAVPSSRIGH